VVFDQAFEKVHDELRTHRIDADWCTGEVILRLPPLRKPPSIISMGSGQGHQTIVLAGHFQCVIGAVDIRQAYLDQMMEAAASAGVAQWIRPRCESLTSLGDPPHTYDLIWCDGAVRGLGLQQALVLWAPLLHKRGVMVVSDCTWLVPDPPDEIAAYCDRLFPGLTDVAGNIRIARAAGLDVFDHFIPPRRDRWEEYYAPLRRRIQSLQPAAAKDPNLAEALNQAQTEIDMFERWGNCYRYVFYLMHPS
jgi:serine/threonine-protein kinase HipA